MYHCQNNHAFKALPPPNYIHGQFQYFCQCGANIPMQKIKPTNLEMRSTLNTYLLTITYKFGNIYTSKTFSFCSGLKMLVEHDKLIHQFPYLVRKNIQNV